MSPNPLPTLAVPDASRDKRVMIARQHEHGDGAEAVQHSDRLPDYGLIDIMILEEVAREEDEVHSLTFCELHDSCRSLVALGPDFFRLLSSLEGFHAHLPVSSVE